MHFNLYLDDETGAQITAAAEKSGESRNALIRQAVKAWLERQNKLGWPEEVLAFSGIADFPPFDANRETLLPPAEDPFA